MAGKGRLFIRGGNHITGPVRSWLEIIHNSIFSEVLEEEYLGLSYYYCLLWL